MYNLISIQIDINIFVPFGNELFYFILFFLEWSSRVDAWYLRLQGWYLVVSWPM